MSEVAAERQFKVVERRVSVMFDGGDDRVYECTVCHRQLQRTRNRKELQQAIDDHTCSPGDARWKLLDIS